MRYTFMLMIVIGLLLAINGIYTILTVQNYNYTIVGVLMLIIGIIGRRKIILRENKKT